MLQKHNIRSNLAHTMQQTATESRRRLVSRFGLCGFCWPRVLSTDGVTSDLLLPDLRVLTQSPSRNWQRGIS